MSVLEAERGCSIRAVCAISPALDGVWDEVTDALFSLCCVSGSSMVAPIAVEWGL